MVGGMAEHSGKVRTRVLQERRRRQFVTAGTTAHLLKSFKDTGFQSGVLQIIGNNGCMMTPANHNGIKAHISHASAPS
jgi:hypothetical protein